jgi:hypothetical protein
MAARDQAKAKAARASVRGELPDASLELQPLDLASLASVRRPPRRSWPTIPGSTSSSTRLIVAAARSTS